MTTTIVYAVDDSGVDSNNATYATARSGGTLAATTTNPWMGQSVGYYCEQYFGRFDASAIPDTDVVSAAVLAIWCVQDISTTDYVLEARLRDYGATATTADFVPGADLAACTLLASRSSASLTVAAYNDYTDVAMPANISKTGYTPMVLCSAEQTNNSAPTGDEDIRMSASLGSGPLRLTITHAAAAGQIIRPDADVSAGSWTATPLWSKVDETSAGGDVITATAS